MLEAQLCCERARSLAGLVRCAGMGEGLNLTKMGAGIKVAFQLGRVSTILG
jgi:hypothetical protein